MTQEELKIVLEKHKKWLDDEDGGERADMSHANLYGVDMSHANMRHANMRHANMRHANLCHANLCGADLRGANLDYSCWPLWCGSLDVRVDKRIFAQLAYHLCCVIVDDEECKAAQEALYPIANQFHRVDECGKLPLEKEDGSHDD